VLVAAMFWLIFDWLVVIFRPVFFGTKITNLLIMSMFIMKFCLILVGKMIKMTSCTALTLQQDLATDGGVLDCSTLTTGQYVLRRSAKNNVPYLTILFPLLFVKFPLNRSLFLRKFALIKENRTANSGTFFLAERLTITADGAPVAVRKVQIR
jgi:hypothetical protein